MYGLIPFPLGPLHSYPGLSLWKLLSHLPPSQTNADFVYRRLKIATELEIREGITNDS